MKLDHQSTIGISTSVSESPRLPSLRISNEQGTELQGQSLRTIVVPLDGSLEAEHALPHAITIARNTGAALRLVRVYSHLDDIEPWHFSQAAAGVKPGKREKQEYLARLARRIARVYGRQPETVLIDSPHTADALESGATGADLVVIGSRRQRFTSRLWWLNTVDQLRQRLAVPLLLTCGSSTPVDLTVNASTRNILVPLDGSMRGQSVLNSAAQLSRSSRGSDSDSRGGMLTLLNVQNEHWSVGHFEHTCPRSYLLSTAQGLKQTGIEAEAQIYTTSRRPGQAIASYAASHDVDLIAIATHGDGGLSRFLRGSVADYLLRQTRIPILLQNVSDVVKRPKLTAVS